ncbi:tail completion protein gp17, partial [Kitasatospora sp. NPDC001574]
LGEAIETPHNTHDRYGRQTAITLHVWSQYRGYGEALTIGARVMALLDHQPLDIEGLAHTVTRYEMGQTLTDPEPPGDIRHLVQRYRILTGQPAG